MREQPLHLVNRPRIWKPSIQFAEAVTKNTMNIETINSKTQPRQIKNCISCKTFRRPIMLRKGLQSDLETHWLSYIYIYIYIYLQKYAS